MPVVYLVRESQQTDQKSKKSYAVYKENIQHGREILGQLILRGWTTPTPPFPERLIVHISQAEGDGQEFRASSIQEPIKQIMEDK